MGNAAGELQKGHCGTRGTARGNHTAPEPTSTTGRPGRLDLRLSPADLKGTQAAGGRPDPAASRRIMPLKPLTKFKGKRFGSVPLWDSRYLLQKSSERNCGMAMPLPVLEQNK